MYKTKHSLTFILILFLNLNILNAQDDENKSFGISFSGFVKNDFFFDSRQTVSAREGHFLLWPAAISLDDDDDDINANPSFNFLAIQSRLSGKITGPDAFGAKTSGVIEGDFFAQANDNINLFRLRHAFIKFNWTNLEVLTGQFWNPFFVTGCFPGTVSFNTGTPLQSFARNPQVRVTYSAGNVRLIGALLGQRDFVSRGVNGPSSEYLRNSVIPDFHAQVHYQGDNVLAGIGTAYKTIVPRLVTSGINNNKVDEKVSGISLLGFSKITSSAVTIKLQGRYGENIADLLSISGFAVKDVVDPLTGEFSYTPLRNATFWGEIHTNGSTFQVGIFGGYLKNLGTKETMSSALNPVYGFGTNIESLTRISPRIIFNSGKARIASELEYTSAAYGSNYDDNYVPESTESVSNIRFLISTYLFF